MSFGLMVADLVIWSSWVGLQDDRWTQFVLHPPHGSVFTSKPGFYSTLRKYYAA